MIIVLKSGVSEEQIQHVIQRVESFGLQAHLSRGTYRTIIGVIGDEAKVQNAPLTAIEGVAEALPILPPFKLASREAHPESSTIDVCGVKVGGGHLAMIAGPCAVESAERLDAIASAVKEAGANILRGGAFKPRTSPYSFQGLEKEGLTILAKVRELREHHVETVQSLAEARQRKLLLEGDTRGPRGAVDANEYQKVLSLDESYQADLQEFASEVAGYRDELSVGMVPVTQQLPVLLAALEEFSQALSGQRARQPTPAVAAALEECGELVEQFPNDGQAPAALFMQAYMYLVQDDAEEIGRAHV